MNYLFNILGAFDSIVDTDSSFVISTCLILLAVSLVLGFLTSITYRFIKRKIGYSSDFPITLIILPVIVSLVIYFVRDNVAGGLSLAGIFTITKFRSEQKDTEDLAYIFLSVAIGLSCGLGYILAAITICLILLIVLLLLHVTKYGKPSQKNMTLKIIVPEDLNFDGLFDDILAKACNEYHLIKTKTSDFGTMFELVYHITLLDGVNQKEFIDEIRIKNGNMNVSLIVRSYNNK